MVTDWTPIPIDYDPWRGGTDVFVRSAAPFYDSFRKVTPARDTGRQAHFVDWLERISWHLGTRTVPVFISFNGEQRRMDKGCIGHAVSAGVLEMPKNGPGGYVEFVRLRESDN